MQKTIAVSCTAELTARLLLQSRTRRYDIKHRYTTSSASRWHTDCDRSGGGGGSVTEQGRWQGQQRRRTKQATTEKTGAKAKGQQRRRHNGTREVAGEKPKTDTTATTKRAANLGGREEGHPLMGNKTTAECDICTGNAIQAPAVIVRHTKERMQRP